MRPVGEVNYLINMHNCRKKRRILHINMLEWHVPTRTNYLALECQENNADDEAGIPTWDGGIGNVKVGEQLTKKQKEQLEDVLSEFSTVLQATPGGTDICEHCIETGDACPI